MNIQINQVARVIYEERVREYSLPPVDRRDSVVMLLIRAIKNAVLIGHNEPSVSSAKAAKLATR